MAICGRYGVLAAIEIIIYFQLLTCDNANYHALTKCVNDTGHETELFNKCQLNHIGNRTSTEIYCNTVCALRSNYHAVINENAVPIWPNISSFKMVWSKLRHIPNGMFCNLSDLNVLYLSNNEIKDISQIGLSMNTCKAHSKMVNNDGAYLDFSFNQISALQGHTFSRYTNLDYIDLHRNGLVEIDQDAFIGVRNISKLNLSQNRLINFHPNLLRYLTAHVMSLYLNNNQISTSTICDISSFGKLKFLVLVNNFLHKFENESKCLETRPICPSPDFKLHLEGNELGSQSLLQIGTFLTNCSMKCIELSSNNLTESTNLKYFSSENISITNNQIQVLDLNDLNSRTELLEISENKIKYVIDAETSYEISRTAIKKVDEFKLVLLSPANRKGNEDLMTFCLNSNRINVYFAVYHLQNKAYFCSFKNSKYRKLFLNLDYDSLIVNCKENHNFSNWEKAVFNIEINDVKQFVCLRSDNETKNSICNSNYWCKPHLKCTPPCTCYYQRIVDEVIVDCHQYFMEETTVAKTKPLETYKVVHVNVGNDYINSKTFNLEMLKVNQIMDLYLNNSGIRFIANYTFSEFVGLKLLNLSHNKITALGDFAFDGLAALQKLYLSDCELEYINVETFNNLTSLVNLALNNNKLKQFSFWQISPITSLKLLELRNNPFTCDCKFLFPLVNTLRNNPQILNDEQFISCNDENSGKEFALTDYDLNQCIYDSVPLLTRVIGILSGVIGLLLLVIGVISYIFKRRVELQVLIYYRLGLRLFHDNNSEELDRDKEWDAFLSYCSDDFEFIRDEFLPKLEDIKNPYKIMIHQRSFIIGQFITENIMMAVARSKRTIVIMNDNFVKSSYCGYEFRVAHAQLMAERFPRLILILIGDEPKNLDPEMKFYMRTNTYLKWGDPYFWEKLYFALPGKKSTEENQAVQETNC